MLTVQNPQCMQCHIEWNRDKMDGTFSSYFRDNALKRHRETVLFDGEVAMLPATMRYVEYEIRTAARRKQIEDLHVQITKLKNDIRHLDYIILRDHPDRPQENPEEKEPVMLTRKCPYENCRGFVNTKWTCGLCSGKMCSTCHEALGDAHTCKEENIQTAKLLASDTKNCPKCGVQIYRISGCSQMFCTQCHTAFDWNTGRIEVHHIHNPHYFEWLQRSNGGDVAAAMAAEANRCEDQTQPMPSSRQMQLYHATSPKELKADSSELCKAHGAVLHLHYEVLHREQRDWTNYQRLPIEHRNRDLRVDYLRNKIDKDQFKRKLQQREKKWERKKAFVQLMQMFEQASGDVFKRVLTGPVDEHPLRCGLKELHELRIYFNEQNLALSQRFKCKPPISILSETWSYLTT